VVDRVVRDLSADVPLAREGRVLTASGVARPGDREGALAGRDRWHWIFPLLIGFSVVVPLACAIDAIIDDHASPTTRAFGAGLAVAYALFAIVALRRVHECTVQNQVGFPLLFVLISAVLFAGMVLTDPVYFLVASLLYWQIFASLPLRWAIAAATAFSVEMMVLQVVWSGGGLLDNEGAMVGAVVSIVVGTILAIWIGGIIDQSSQRAVLITELEATRAELADAHHGAGVLAERERMAREIHDTLAQGFTSIVMLSQAAAATDDPAESRRLVGSIERTARDNLAEARALVEGGGPAVLEEGSLVGALERLADRTAADTGIAATTRVRGTPRALASATEVALLRTAQEAVANVRRHAQAQALCIEIDYGGPVVATSADVGAGPAVGEALDAAEVTVEVVDDGCGFDVTAPSGGFGLAGMRSRLELVGGRFEVRSEQGRGTVVRAAVP
jgi:signal transduction histidine kinase